MLHTETVEQSTLELLIKLQKQEYLKGFYLVGGTALALKIGHRKSIDIDLFSDFSFDVSYIVENLSADFSFELFFAAKNAIKGSINNIQIDILAHRYPLINTPETTHNISMLSTEDIIAMKLNAIVTNGQRVKDFIDIYFLLKQYTFNEMLLFYKKKYPGHNEVMVLKSIIWFEDVDLSEWPVLLKATDLKWTEVKERINNAIQSYLVQFK